MAEWRMLGTGVVEVLEERSGVCIISWTNEVPTISVKASDLEPCLSIIAASDNRFFYDGIFCRAIRVREAAIGKIVILKGKDHVIRIVKVCDLKVLKLIKRWS